MTNIFIPPVNIFFVYMWFRFNNSNNDADDDKHVNVILNPKKFSLWEDPWLRKFYFQRSKYEWVESFGCLLLKALVSQ
jgi:hypothetical protein